MVHDMDVSGNIGLALILTVIAGLSTGIGSAIAYFIKKPKMIYLSFSLGFSAGVMIYISFMELLPKGLEGVGEVLGVTAFFIGIIFIGIIVTFSYATSEMTNITVGSFFGSDNLDINIPGEDYYKVMSCSWGPGISFYIFLSSIIILGIVILFNFKNRSFLIKK